MQTKLRMRRYAPCETCGSDAPSDQMSLTCNLCLVHRCFSCAFCTTVQTDCCRSIVCLEHIVTCNVCRKYACRPGKGGCDGGEHMERCTNARGSCSTYACPAHSRPCYACKAVLCVRCVRACCWCLRTYCNTCPLGGGGGGGDDDDDRGSCGACKTDSDTDQRRGDEQLSAE